MSKLPHSGYSTAAESMEEGYLAKKFKRIIAERKREKAEQAKVKAEAEQKVKAIIISKR